MRFQPTASQAVLASRWLKRGPLDEMRRREGASLNELVIKAIEEYLFAHQFRLLRERMVPKAQEQGIYTDQDVFERVS
jgi:hypothetical protein